VSAAAARSPRRRVDGRPRAPRVGPKPGHKAEVAIWDLLCWAFQREFASVDFGRITSLGGQPMPGYGMEFVLLEQARLGCRVDGGGHSDPHPDADVVAAALSALPEVCGGRPMAVQIAELARAGQVPDWMGDATPRLVPVEMHTNRHGCHAKTADAAVLGSVGWPHWKRRNRKNVVVEEVVTYCPTIWRPSAAQIAAARRGYQLWWGALLELRINLQIGAPLSAFEVTDAMPPMTPWAKGRRNDGLA